MLPTPGPGEPFDAALFGECVQACALTLDLAAMPGGDQTELGERGTASRGLYSVNQTPLSMFRS